MTYNPISRILCCKVVVSMVLLCVATPSTGAATPLPSLFTQRQLSCSSVSKAVNYFVAMGESRAIKSLTAISNRSEFMDTYLETIRINEVCRILFEPNAESPLRPAGIGGYLDYPNWPETRQNWPLFPAAASGKSYFVLTESIGHAGVAEPIPFYLHYCKVNGEFRKSPISVPTRAEALHDALALRQSKQWRACYAHGA